MGDADSVFTLLLFSGYLKSVGKDEENSSEGVYSYFLKIPNKEIRGVFSREILKKLHPKGRDILGEIWRALERRDERKLESCLTDFLSECESSYDDASESVYHDICLGFSAYKYGEYHIRSNRETGDGRYDYDLRARGFTDIIKVGLAFSGKHARVAFDL